jgi:hypothetical protein
MDIDAVLEQHGVLALQRPLSAVLVGLTATATSRILPVSETPMARAVVHGPGGSSETDHGKWIPFPACLPARVNLNAVVVVNVAPGFSTTDGQPCWPMWLGESG